MTSFKNFLACAILVGSTSAVAESNLNAPYTADPGPRAGDYEATLTGSGLSDDSFDDNNLGVTGSIGYFLTENWLVALKQSVQTNATGGSNLVSGRSVFQAAYQFDIGRLQPYIGMNIGATYGAGFKDSATIGPELGLKYYVNESTFLYGNMAYELPVEECCNEGTVPYAFGVGFNF